MDHDSEVNSKLIQTIRKNHGKNIQTKAFEQFEIFFETFSENSIVVVLSVLIVVLSLPIAR